MSELQENKQTFYFCEFARRPLPYPMRLHEATVYLLAMGIAAFIGLNIGVWINSWLFPEPTAARMVPMIVASLACIVLTEFVTGRFPPEDLTERKRKTAEQR